VIQIPVVYINLCVNLFGIKEIRVITLNPEEELIPDLFGRNIVRSFKLKLHQNMLPFEVNYLPREVQLGDVEAVFFMSVVVRVDIHLKLGGVQIG